MGSGNSRLNNNNNNGAAGDRGVTSGVPTKFRSSITGRFEEYYYRKGRRINIGESKKQLLKVKEEDSSTGVSECSNSHETTTAAEDHNKDPIHVVEPNNNSIIFEPTREIRVIPISSLSTKEEEEKDTTIIDPKVNIAEEAAEIKTDQEGGGHVVEEVIMKPEKVSSNDDEEEEEEEYGRLMLFPGSPSFRIYCIEADQRKEKEEDEDEEYCKSPNNNQKSHSAASRNSIISHPEILSQNAREVVVSETSSTKRIKAGGGGGGINNKMKKFRHVKTLLKVKYYSCYNPCTCTSTSGGGDDRRQLIAARK